MSERWPHSLRSDIIIGVGGSALALAVSVPFFRSERVEEPKRTVYLYGIAEPNDCMVDKINNTVECSPNITQDCVEWLEELLPMDPEEVNLAVDLKRKQEDPNCVEVPFGITWDLEKIQKERELNDKHE